MRLGWRLLSQFDDNEQAEPIFVGRDESNEKLEGHIHMHVIPESLEGDGKSSHVTLYAPLGFNERAQEAISSLQKVWMNSPVQFDLVPILLGFGK